MDVMAEIAALKARIEVLEGRARAEDSLLRDDMVQKERERQRQRARGNGARPVPFDARASLIEVIGPALRAVVAAVPPAALPAALAEGPPAAALRAIAAAPGCSDETKVSMLEAADECARLGLTWADFGIAAEGA